MADQADFVEGVQVCYDSDGGRADFAEGVQFCEEEAAAPPAGGNPWNYYAQAN